METRVALIGIVVENTESVEKINELLHKSRKYVIGRMGIPYSKKNINIISIVIDAPPDVISALSGKLGMLPGVNTKTIYSKVSEIKEGGD
ncbi:TM1266 family iron-only hydrogenase system putative regulator [Sedimentibacter sp.]|uniref:TM1266 family iron-only hydrogenase system putative regulator n=1 Tax=Sedimentibacter sp. TaxID=1960295 RepID=UPI0028B2624C|nr:TM1266 family iron-only hydrogenase system putative regulator [Sedimentibacter sp.]